MRVIGTSSESHDERPVTAWSISHKYLQVRRNKFFSGIGRPTSFMMRIGKLHFVIVRNLWAALSIYHCGRRYQEVEFADLSMSALSMLA